MRIISKEKREGRDLCRAVRNRVVLEFGSSEEFGPLVRIIGTKDTKISFYFLIGPFSLSIGLGVISGGEADIVLQNPSKLSSESRGELGTTIRDDSVMQSEAFEHMVKKELSNAVCVNRLRARN